MNYGPDCADCPEPEVCKAKNDCSVLRQIRHGHERKAMTNAATPRTDLICRASDLIAGYKDSVPFAAQALMRELESQLVAKEQEVAKLQEQSDKGWDSFFREKDKNSDFVMRACNAEERAETLLAQLSALQTRQEGDCAEAIMPDEPTKEILEILARSEWPDDWQTGKSAQIRLGLNVIPPVAEMEVAYGQYKRLYEAIRALLSPTPAEEQK